MFFCSDRRFCENESLLPNLGGHFNDKTPATSYFGFLSLGLVDYPDEYLANIGQSTTQTTQNYVNDFDELAKANVKMDRLIKINHGKSCQYGRTLEGFGSEKSSSRAGYKETCMEHANYMRSKIVGEEYFVRIQVGKDGHLPE
jgi:hypothetical protein